MDKFSKQKIVEQIAEITSQAHLGSLMEKDIEVSVNVRQKRGMLPPNIMVFQTFAYLSATSLKPATNKVLMFFFALSAYENYIGIDVQTIMQELNLSKPTVTGALKELQDQNIILKFPNNTDKRRNDYFINPLSAWKGNSFTRQKMIKNIEKHNPNQLTMFNEAITDDISLIKGKSKEHSLLPISK